MFHSVPRRPISEIGAHTMRLQSCRSFRRSAEEGREKFKSVPWLSRNMGLLLSWLKRAGVDASEAVGSGQKRKGLLSIFADHCSFVTGQRLRRTCQIGELYSNLYSERTRWTLVGNIWRRFQSKHAPTGKLIAALAGVFMWENEKIQDEEIRRLDIILQTFMCMQLCSDIIGNTTPSTPSWNCYCSLCRGIFELFCSTLLIHFEHFVPLSHVCMCSALFQIYSSMICYVNCAAN